MGLRLRLLASATNLKAPNILPWSVRATPLTICDGFVHHGGNVGSAVEQGKLGVAV